MTDAHVAVSLAATYDRVAGHLVGALGAAGVPDPTVAKIVGAIAPLAGEIVSAPAS